ncbi:Dihydroxyacetone synthase [Ceratobasidium sp. 414]|nr:Dihydroxyacetone synthase [Ceratobasidium sp. 414]
MRFLSIAAFVGLASAASIPAANTCPAGKYPSGNACVDCPAGSYSAAGAMSCSDCPPGTISDPGSSTCTACPDGWVPTPSGRTCRKCPANTYANGDDCTPCPDGQTSSPGSTSCGPQPSKRAVSPVSDTCSLTPGYQRCPVLTGGGGTECVNVLTTPDSCGGCVGPDGVDDKLFTGQDCSAIPNVDRVECEQGRCKVVSCRSGYTPGQGTCALITKRAKVHGHGSI